MPTDTSIFNAIIDIKKNLCLPSVVFIVGPSMKLQNPNWQEADQLAIYKRGRGVELGAAGKQLLLAVRARLEPGASGLHVRHSNPLDHTAC